MPNVPNNTLVTFLPQGLDRADGLPHVVQGQTIQIGTPTSADGLSVKTPLGETVDYIPVNELPDSPTIERAEQCTATHKVSCSWNAAQTYLTIYGRGKLLSDSGGNWYRVLSSTIQHKKGDYAELSITSESISFDNPPDEFSINPVKLNLDLLKHPRYFSNLIPLPSDTSTYTTVGDYPVTVTYSDIKQALVRMIQTYRDSPFFPSEDALNGQIQSSVLAGLKGGKLNITIPFDGFVATNQETPPAFWDGTVAHVPTGNPRYVIVPVSVNLSNPSDPVTIAIAATKEIIYKLWRNEDTPLLNGWELTWTSYYWAPIRLNPGSYIEDPFGLQGGNGQTAAIPNAVPPVPDYFFSTVRPPNTSYNIFDYIAAYNPQCYSSNGLWNGGANISWLRDADTMEYNRTWFKVTRKWLGAPVGAWDKDLYNQDARPSSATDYNQNSP